MSEQKPEKKVVGRTVAIALGIICIILAVGLVGAVADYTSIISGNETYYQNQISSLNSQISSLNAQINSLQDQVTNLIIIVKTLASGHPNLPIITSVSPIAARNSQTITIVGNGFGSMPATTTLGDGSVDMPNFKITEGDGSGWGSNWNAGCTDQADLIGVYLLSWNDTTIVISGFGTYLGQTTHGAHNCYWLVGDKITVMVNGALWTTTVVA